MNREIIFFCDGGGGFGLGHVTRCGALAGEFAANGHSMRFVINGGAQAPGFAFENRRPPHTWAAMAHGAACVIDSYAMSGGDISNIWREAAACLWIDDENLRPYPGGLIVNPSLYGNSLGYSNPGARHLLGGDYIILRRAFRRKTPRAVKRRVEELTIIMGGTDAGGMLPETAERLGGLPCKKNIVGAVGCAGYNCLPGLSAESVAELFLKSDLVISAGGQTVNELIQLNTPSILIEAAPNQRGNIEAAVKRGLAAACAGVNGLTEAVLAMDYAERLRMCAAMSGYDFSNGTGNIAGEFLALLNE